MKTKLVRLAKRLALFGFQAMMLSFFVQGMAYATGGTPSGSGTEGDPFLIADYEDLKVVGTDSLTYSLSSVYRLTADIDALPSDTANGGKGFVPIGTDSNPFKGVFHGGGYIIDGLTINRPATGYVGLFGYINNSTIDSLGLSGGNTTGGNSYVGSLIGGNDYGTVSVCYSSNSVSGNYSVGGLIGYSGYGSTVRGSYATGSVMGSGDYVGGLVGLNSCLVSESYATGTVKGNGNYIGGLVGYNGGNPVEKSYATGSVTGSNYYVGGLVGYNDNSIVSESYATGSVTCSNYYVGGLVGFNRGSTVSGCYSTGSVTCSGDYIGGLVGYNIFNSTVSSSYATGSVTGGNIRVGGLVGCNNSTSTVAFSYWNIETTEMTTGIGLNDFGSVDCTGLTTSPMKQDSSFIGWSFDTTWAIIIDSTYPGVQTIDNAPFAFYDTLISNRTFDLPRLLLNDCDIETAQNKLMV